MKIKLLEAGLYTLWMGRTDLPRGGEHYRSHQSTVLRERLAFKSRRRLRNGGPSLPIDFHHVVTNLVSLDRAPPGSLSPRTRLHKCTPETEASVNFPSLRVMAKSLLPGPGTMVCH